MYSFERNRTKNSNKYKEIMKAINNFSNPSQEYRNQSLLNSTIPKSYSPLKYNTIPTSKNYNNVISFRTKPKNVFGLKLDFTNKNNEKFVLKKTKNTNKTDVLSDVYNFELIKFEGMLKRGKKYEPPKIYKKMKEVKFKPDNEELEEEKKRCLRKLNYWDYL